VTRINITHHKSRRTKRGNAHLRNGLPFHSFVFTETVFRIITQRPTYITSIRPSSVQTVETSTTISVKKHVYLQVFFSFSETILLHYPVRILQHLKAHWATSISVPTKCFLFHKLSCLVLEIFRFFEYHAQNLNTLQNNSVSWDLQMGFNLAFKGLR
jgi:hypothetical protein